MMRTLFWAVTLAGLGWSAYWFIGAHLSKSALQTWLEARRAEGWQVEYSDLRVRGFPNRFDTTVEMLALTDPETGLSWEAPFFQVFALSYNPRHLIAIWPETQLVATPYQKITLSAQKMQASVVVADVTQFTLDRANLIMEGATLSSSEGWNLGFDLLNGAIRSQDGVEFGYEVAARAETLSPSDDLRALIDRAGDLPKVIEGAELDLAIDFDAPLSRATIETARPGIEALDLRLTRGSWGELELRAAGALDIDTTGQATGEIALNARNWREMLRLAVEAGAIEPGAVDTIELGLGLLAGLSGSQESIDAPLSFRAGRMSLGPVPLGPAPRFVLR